ncbi:hypothetical protein L1O03_00275 [Corynebacterium uropygiale]|uniref:Secreted protein n=1 Tax=Corynebacterium uropygiale TaxID=1775911 RepID=A0A9X1QPZ8_9CORY|nr:hypothetical protein [Corynebacterium uropygiale]MCF4005623.1 hypothetical protein [Corynebacterium uropygiale]
MLVPWGAARMVSSARPEVGLSTATVGNSTGTWSLPLTRADGSPLQCAHTRGSAAEFTAWDCQGVEVSSIVAEKPENADRALRRAMRAVTFVGVSPETAPVVTQDLGERGEIAAASMALTSPVGKKQSASPVVAFQLRPKEGEHAGSVLTVVLHRSSDEGKTRDAAAAVWQTLAGVEPQGEMRKNVEVTGA